MMNFKRIKLKLINYKKIELIKNYSILKTLYYNFRYLPLNKAMKFPFIIGKKTRLNIKGKFIIKNYNKKIIIDKKSNINIYGAVVCNGRVHIGESSGIYVGKNAILTVGNNLRVTSGLSLNCLKKITIGNEVLIAWECTILDSDFHKIYDISGKRTNEDRAITIKNNVWIGNNAIILKGTSIYNNIVIGAGSVVSGILDIENTVYAGNPAKPIKYNINWKY